MRIGIDIGGSHIAVGFINNKYELVSKKEISIKELKTNDDIKVKIENIIVKFIREILIENNENENNIEIIGIGSPGTVKEGIIYNAVNLGIDCFNIKNAIGKYFKTKIYVQNDCKCSGIGEKEKGALKEYSDCVFLALGTGIGGVVFMQDNMLIPNKFPGFEFGHMIINKNGNTCNCGNIGCFETYASMKKFKQDIINTFNLNKNIHGKQIYQYIKLHEDDIKIKECISKYISNLTIGLTNIINIFEPEAICLGGSFSYYEDILLNNLKENLKGKLFNNSCPDILIAKHKNDAGLIGAAILDKYQRK